VQNQETLHNVRHRSYSDYLHEHAGNVNRLCGLVVRVPGCRHRAPGFDSRRYQIFRVAVGPEQGLLSLVRTNEELLEREVEAPVQKTEIDDRRGSAALTTRHPSIHKSWH
jgi:hypothetical protein